jgi:hypothetical protein
MDKREFIQLAQEVFKPLGYKRKNCNWSSETSELIRIFNLQKSMYGDLYYLNCSFIIKGLKLGGCYHVMYRFYYKDNEEQNLYMHQLLDFENGMSDNERKKGLKQLLEDMGKDMGSVHTIEGLRQYIIELNILAVPDFVLSYLDLEERKK